MRSVCAGFVLVLLCAGVCLAGETVSKVRSAGALACGVRPGVAGLAVKDAAGGWSGLEVDFCRAVAAAVLGDKSAIRFVGLSTLSRFPSLLAREVDLLAAGTSWTIGREAQLGVSFVGPLVITGQAFLVLAKSGVKTIKDLDNAPVGVLKGATHVQNLAELMARTGLNLTPVVYDTFPQALEGLSLGQCRAVTEDGLALAAIARAGSGGQAYEVLQGGVSLELVSVAVRPNDREWLLIVESVLAALLAAEEHGLTGEMARRGDMAALSTAAAHLVQRADHLAKPLGLAPGWLLRAVGAGGNYGELFENNLGAQSPLKLDRGRNNLRARGGLMYAPPF